MSRISSASICEPNNFALEFCKKLLSFSKNNKFSDVCIISSDDVKFHAHKCVLSAFSDYFMVMFESGLKESTANEVKIPEVNGKVLKLILTFLYIGRIDFQNDQVADILVAANFFQIQNLIDECIYFIGQNMDAHNCLDIAIFADKHSFIELFEIATTFAAEHFEKVFSCNEFINLEEKVVSIIVLGEFLYVTSEEAVFLKLIEWIEHDKPNRAENTCILFSKIRYWLLSPQFIKQHRSKLPYTIEYLEMVCTWFEWHSLPIDQRELKDKNISTPKDNVVHFVGGGAIQTYDPVLRSWSRKEFSNLPSRFRSIVLFNNKLIFWTEGYLTSFDLQTQKLAYFEPKWNKQIDGMAVLGNDLYLLCSIYIGEREVFKYDSTNRSWNSRSPLKNNSESVKVAVSNGELYVFSLSSPNIQCYNPTQNQWTHIRVSETVPGCGFTGVDGNLYMIGGKSQNECLPKAHKKIISTDMYGNTCSQRAQMKIGITDPHCIQLNNRLLVCGGFDESGSRLNLVHEYHPKLNEWRTLPSLIEYNPSEFDYCLLAV